MAKKFQLSAVITAVDNVTRPVRQATAGLRRATSAITKFNNRMRASARAVGFDKLATQARRTGVAAKNLGGSLGRLGLKVGALAAAFGFVIVKNAQMGDELIKTSRRVGVPLQTLSRFSIVADRAGINFDVMARGFRNIARNSDAARKGAGEALPFFQKFNIEFQDINGNLRPTEEILLDIADVFQDLPDGPEKTVAAMRLIGEEAGPLFINALNGGSDALKKMLEDSDRFGLTIDTKTAVAMENFNDAMADTQSAFQGITLAISANLIPVLTPLIKRLTDFLVENRELIETKVISFIKQFAAALETAFEKLTRVWKIIQPLVELVGGPANAAFIALAATLVGPVVGSLVAMIASTTKLAFTFGKVLFLSLKTLIPIIIKFGIALLTTPIGQIALAIGILIIIFKKMNDAVQLGGGWGLVWEGFKITVDEVTESIVGSIRSVIDWIIRMSKIIKEKAGAFTAFIPGIGPAIELISRLSPSDAPGPSGSGRPAIPQQGRAGAQGQVDVNVNLSNLPKGTTTDVRSDGEDVNLALEQGVALVTP